MSIFKKVANNVTKSSSIPILPLDRYPSSTSKAGKAFTKKYGKSGIYIVLQKKVLGDLSLGEIVKKDIENTLSKFCELATYIGQSMGILSRIGSMRSQKASTNPHGLATYSQDNNVSPSDLVLIFIPLCSKSAKQFEDELFEYNMEKTGKRFIAQGYSSQRGENAVIINAIFAKLQIDEKVDTLKIFSKSTADELLRERLVA